MPPHNDILIRIGFSLAVGLLLGLERERGENRMAGIRTFPIIALFGTISGLLAQEFGAWIPAAGLLAVSSVLVASNFIAIRCHQQDPDDDSPAGVTTEVAALFLYALGVYVVFAPLKIAAVFAGSFAVLLYYKALMHRFVAGVGKDEMNAIMKFVLLALIVLPILPDQTYGPYNVLNPFGIWLMVVLIVGMTLAGYTAYRIVGTKAGTLLGGIFGGLISSTAISVSYGRLSAASPGIGKLVALVIMIASTVSFARVLIEIFAVAPESFTSMAYPLAALLAWCVLISGAMWLISRRGEAPEMPDQENPAQLKSAITFGLIYAGVLLAIAAAKENFGVNGLYVVGFISGLTDMDAITLSTAKLVQKGSIEADTAWRTIMIASLANFIFKYGIVAVLGKGSVKIWLAAAFGAAITGGIVIIWLWP